MFYLRHCNDSVLKFDIDYDNLDGQRLVLLSNKENIDYRFLPDGVSPDPKGLLKWIKRRVISSNRENSDSLLSAFNISRSDIKGIIRLSRLLSLNDVYWITENINDKFEDYNLYENSFESQVTSYAFMGRGKKAEKSFVLSPEFTTSGKLRKGWQRLDGKILLYKGGTSGASNAGNEPYSEYYASQIARKMGLKHVDYSLSKWKGCICSVCELFTDIDHSYVPIYRFVEDYSLRTVSDYIRCLGCDYYDEFVDMLIFDALIYNEDRHFGNFGLIVDSKTNRPCSFAPIFDNGLSLFNYATDEKLADIEGYAKTRSSAYGVPFDNIVKEFITPRQKEQLRKMIGFRFEKDKNYNLPARRLKIIEEQLHRRAAEMLEM